MRATLARTARAILVAGPLATLVLTLFWEVREHQIAPDFHWALFPQAHALWASGVPFDPPHVVLTGENRIYTVTAAMLVIPLTSLPVGTAALLWTALAIACAVLMLFFAGVRDPRVYGAAFLSAPVLAAIQAGNLTLPLCALAALAWHYRARRYAPGVAIGLACALKVIMWPLAVWLLLSRRFAAGATATAIGAASVLLIVPFANPLDYFTLAARNAQWGASGSYSLYALLGATESARLAWIALAIAALVASAFTAEAAGFALATVACILFSPIVWVQYFAFVFVALAVLRPRFGPLWLLPLGYWLTRASGGSQWQIALALGIMAAITLKIVVPADALRRLALPLAYRAETTRSTSSP